MSKHKLVMSENVEQPLHRGSLSAGLEVLWLHGLGDWPHSLLPGMVLSSVTLPV